MSKHQFILLLMVLFLMVGNIFLTTPRFAQAKSENDKGPNINASDNANKDHGNNSQNNGNSGNNTGNNNNSNGNNGNNNNNGNNGNNGNNSGGNGNGKGEEKITICHVPPGNPDKAIAITIGLPGWQNGHDPHQAHALDFVVDGSHPCPPGHGGGGNPTPTPTPGGTGGGSSGSSSSGSSSSSSNSSGGVGGASTEKQGQILGTETLASTGVFSDLLSSALQFLGFVMTIFWSIRYAATKKTSA